MFLQGQLGAGPVTTEPALEALGDPSQHPPRQPPRGGCLIRARRGARAPRRGTGLSSSPPHRSVRFSTGRSHLAPALDVPVYPRSRVLRSPSRLPRRRPLGVAFSCQAGAPGRVVTRDSGADLPSVPPGVAHGSRAGDRGAPRCLCQPQPCEAINLVRHVSDPRCWLRVSASTSPVCIPG